MTYDWTPIEQCKARIPSSIWPWIADKQSMTQAMRRAAGSIGVILLAQQWARPMKDEVDYLNLDYDQYVLAREVYMHKDKINWIYGRVIMPRSLFTGQYRYLLKELDTRPIGDLLYKTPGVKREEIEAKELIPEDKLFLQAMQQHDGEYDSLWARRAKFYLFDNVLSVTEVVFPEIPDYVKQT